MGPISGGPINLRSARLQDAGFRFATLSAADLEAADMSGADLVHARFDRANLSAANLSNALLDHADFAGAKLTNVNFCAASMRFANMATADLEAADMSGADLLHARFDRANLSAANLSNALLDHADFADANLTKVNLSGASLYLAKNLTQAQLEESIGSDLTILPPHLQESVSWSVARSQTETTALDRRDPRDRGKDSLRGGDIGRTFVPDPGGTIEPMEGVKGNVARSKELVASATEDLKQHHRWLKGYLASEKRDRDRRMGRRWPQHVADVDVPHISSSNRPVSIVGVLLIGGALVTTGFIWQHMNEAIPLDTSRGQEGQSRPSLSPSSTSTLRPSDCSQPPLKR